MKVTHTPKTIRELTATMRGFCKRMDEIADQMEKKRIRQIEVNFEKVEQAAKVGFTKWLAAAETKLSLMEIERG